MYKQLSKSKNFHLTITADKTVIANGTFRPAIGRKVTGRGGKKIKRIPKKLGGTIDVGLAQRYEAKEFIKTEKIDVKRLEEHVMAEEIAHARQVMNDVKISPLEEDLLMDDSNMEFEAKTIKGIVMTEMGYDDIPSYVKADKFPILLGQTISEKGFVDIKVYHENEEQWRNDPSLKSTYKDKKHTKGQQPVHLIQLLEE